MSEFFDGNRITLLNSGDEYFPALLAAIDSANQEIFLESYIFADDEVGNAVVAALIRAADRNVAVRVLVDGFGARNFPRDFGQRLQAARVKYLIYRREVARFSLKRHRLRRMHRKLVVIDACFAFVGGINIIDDHNAPPALQPRYDYAVQVEGPLLAPIRHAVQRMWENVAWANFKRRYQLPAEHHTANIPPAGNQRASFLLRDNTRNRHSIINAYLRAIQNSKKEIIIASAYFLPGLRFRHALKAAAQRGVKVTVLLQGPSDHLMMYYATQALCTNLLNAGVQIFEYRQGFLHAKVAVIDEYWATVGSSNIDPFSLLLAKEGNVVVEDEEFARELRSGLKKAITDKSTELTQQTLGRLPLHTRFLRWSSYGIVRFLIDVAGYSQKHWQEDQR